MRLIILFLVLFTLTACAVEQHDWSKFSVYDKAIDIDNYIYPNGSANQVFYKVKAEYPNKDVLNFYITTIKSPWVKCEESNNWESFGDVSGNEPLFIHQAVQRWVNRDKNRILLLAIKYRSQGSENRKTPDNNIQNVYLIEYYESNITDTLSAIGVSCDGV